MKDAKDLKVRFQYCYPCYHI